MVAAAGRVPTPAELSDALGVKEGVFILWPSLTRAYRSLLSEQRPNHCGSVASNNAGAPQSPSALAPMLAATGSAGESSVVDKAPSRRVNVQVGGRQRQAKKAGRKLECRDLLDLDGRINGDGAVKDQVVVNAYNRKYGAPIGLGKRRKATLRMLRIPRY